VDIHGLTLFILAMLPIGGRQHSGGQLYPLCIELWIVLQASPKVQRLRIAGVAKTRFDCTQVNEAVVDADSLVLPWRGSPVPSLEHLPT
jgi:hypothetical protein